MAADLVLYGDIVTMHEEAPRAQALAVTGGRFRWSGLPAGEGRNADRKSAHKKTALAGG